MKNLLFILGILISSISNAQSYKVGKIDADGKPLLIMEQKKCCTMLNQFSTQRNVASIHVSDLSFTQLNRGQFCITGYEKDADGKIIKGLRIQCSQDDENNLIVIKTNYSERISGKAFATIAAQN